MRTPDRRGFLRVTGLAGVSGLVGLAGVAACNSGESTPTASPTISSPATRTTAPVPSTTSPTRPPPPDWNGLRERLAGELLRPGDGGYDGARTTYNTVLAERRPAAIATCTKPADVQACVDTARVSATPVAARSGGHSYPGYSTPDDALVVDLGGITGVRVRPDGTVVIGAGARLIDVYAGLAEHGRALPAGSCPTVGIAGLTLGGGLGVLNRLHGLTCDRLRAAEVVLADGTAVTASNQERTDLFWALRGGGGGNFGIVTSFTFDTVPATDLTLVSLRFGAGTVPDVLGGWQDWVADLPDELWSNCVVTAGNPPSCRVNGCFAGSPGGVAGLVDDLVRRSGVRPAGRWIQPMGHLDAMRYFAGCSNQSVASCGASRPAGFAASSRILADPLRDPAAVAATVAGRHDIDLLFDSLGGAVGRIAPDATAFPHRGAVASVQVYAEADRGNAGAMGAAVGEVQSALADLVGPGAYVNYLDPGQPDWAQAYYGANLPRLRRVAADYDPDRVFAFPQGITAT